MKLDRMLGILTVLLRNEQVTAPFLAEKFEVSRRTIGRDIDALCRAGIPVVTRQGEGGGISIADGFKLDKSILTGDELSEIVAALKGIGSVSDKSSIERTLDKLAPGREAVVSLREPVVIDLASHYKGSLTDKIKVIKKAIIENKLIEFEYYYEKGCVKRSIEPYFVIFQWSAWYVFGYCLERRDWRTFKLSRLWELTSPDIGFEPREVPEGRRQLLFPDDKTLVALFDPSVRYQLIDAYGLDCYTETAGGKLRLEIGFTNRDFITAWLLGFGSKVTVQEPGEIAQAIKSEAQKTINNYNEQDI